MVLMMFLWIRESRPASAIAPEKHRRRAGTQRLPHRLSRPRVHRLLPRRGAARVLHRQLRVDLLGLHHRLPRRADTGSGGCCWPSMPSSSPPCSTRWCAPRVSQPHDPAGHRQRAAGAGIGGSAFAGPLWSLIILIVVMSVGETLLSPVASAEVSDLAPRPCAGATWASGRSSGAAAPLLGAGLRWLGDGCLRRAAGVRHPAGRGARRRRPVPGAGAGLERRRDRRGRRTAAPEAA